MNRETELYIEKGEDFLAVILADGIYGLHYSFEGDEFDLKDMEDYEFDKELEEAWIIPDHIKTMVKEIVKEWRNKK